MNKDSDEIITIRNGQEDDRAFIMATWLRGLYYGNPWFEEIEKDNFMSKYHNIITNILSKPTTIIYMAVLESAPDTILGYSVTEPKILHWVFVKEVWRRIGIAKRLIPETSDICTHLTILGRKLKPQHMEFDPFKL